LHGFRSDFKGRNNSSIKPRITIESQREILIATWVGSKDLVSILFAIIGNFIGHNLGQTFRHDGQDAELNHMLVRTVLTKVLGLIAICPLLLCIFVYWFVRGIGDECLIADHAVVEIFTQ
jgi:integral membrane sensor domain MASE1